VLLISDLNSNVPATIAPQNIQAIVTGTGENYGQIKYIKDGLVEKFSEENIIYTSGTGDIFKSGIPIGKLRIAKEDLLMKFYVEFYSDFSQLKYVFAEVITKSDIPKTGLVTIENNKEKNFSESAKIKILEDELKIIEDTNLKFIEENLTLKNKINNLNNKTENLNTELFFKNKKIKELNIDEEELKFLRFNLEHGHKCRKSRKLFKTGGFDIKSEQYRKCVLSKGEKTGG
tara:strand:- start:136 stop:828 length:693 start_codon:yes stop_codon:yes gene_type:complete